MDIFWTKQEQNQIKLGFTKTFLEKAGELWHIYPIKHKVSKGKPFLVIESTEEQLSIESPLTGKITYMSDKAITFPCLLKEDDVVAIISDEVVEETPMTQPYVDMPVAGVIHRHMLADMLHMNHFVHVHEQARGTIEGAVAEQQRLREVALGILNQVNPPQGDF